MMSSADTDRLRRLRLAALVVLAAACHLPLPARANWDWLPPAQACDSHLDYTPAPFEGTPPPLPKLPVQYSMNIQANILQKGWSSEVEEHYDGINKKATVFLTFNGTTTQTIFNFDNMEKYDIYPNGTCNTRPGRASFYGFFKMDRQNRPIMSTVNEMFRMGPKYNFSYVGQTWVRGVKVNHWTSCQEWQQLGSRFQLDYYFTHPSYQTAWGQGQIPVRAVVNGSAMNVDMHHNRMKGSHRFDHIYDFTSFRVGPIKDKSVFLLPKEVVCTGRTDHKAMPQIPDNFQMDMELNYPIMDSTTPMQQSLRYDWEHQMVEMVRRLPLPQWSWKNRQNAMPGKSSVEDSVQQRQQFFSQGKITVFTSSTVDDYNAGLRYITDKNNNTCRVMPLDMSEDSMGHGNTLLTMHRAQKANTSPFTYQGRSKFRDMPVDVWGMDSGGVVQKVFFLAKTRKRGIKHRSSDDASTSMPVTGSPYYQRGSQPTGSSPRHPYARGRGARGSRPTQNPAQTSESSQGWRKGLGNVSAAWERYKNQAKPTSSDQPTQTNQQHQVSKVSLTGLPFPVLVGMLFRNHSAIDTRHMPKLFQQVISPEVFKWMSRFPARDDDSQTEATSEDPDHLDRLVSMDNLHSKVLRHMGELDTNVFHFQPLHTDETMFQVSQCFPPEQTSHVTLHIDTPFKENVQHNRAAFLIAMRKALAEYMRMSYLHVSNLYPTPMVDKAKNLDMTRVTFSLLGTPPVKSSKITQPTIQEAKQLLKKAIRNGISFKVKYGKDTKSFFVDKDRYTMDAMVGMFKNSASNDDVMISRDDSPIAAGQAAGRGNKESGSGDSGSKYSSGAVAGIAIATLLVGSLVAAGLVGFFFKRRNNPSDAIIPYQKEFKA